MKQSKIPAILLSILISTMVVSFPAPAFADCNSMRGPIIKDARKALDSKNVTWALKWVYKDRDLEIQTAFDRALKEREAIPSRKEITDQIFFETVLRVHCEGENIPYSAGMMPGEEKADPLLDEMDRSLETGYVEDLVNMATKDINKGIRERFAKVVVLQPQQQDNVDAARKYVEAYLDLFHYLENIKQQEHKK